MKLVFMEYIICESKISNFVRFMVLYIYKLTFSKISYSLQNNKNICISKVFICIVISLQYIKFKKYD